MHVLESCGGSLTEGSGELKSPNYPNKYPNNEECIWSITVEEGAQVALKFETFEVLLISHISHIQLLCDSFLHSSKAWTIVSMIMLRFEMGIVLTATRLEGIVEKICLMQ